jgi:putative transposase
MVNMKKSKFTESQIVKALKEHESVRSDQVVYRELGVSTVTFFKGKQRYGGLEVSDVQRIRELEEENNRLKKMFPNLSLMHEALKDAVEKKL